MISSLKWKLVRLFEHRGFRKYFFNIGWLFDEEIFNNWR